MTTAQVKQYKWPTQNLSEWIASLKQQTVSKVYGTYEALFTLLELANLKPYTFLDLRPQIIATKNLEYGVLNQRYYADLYQPEHDVRAAIVLIPGAVPCGKEDPRVITFAKTLARARFAVLVPDVVALSNYQLLPESADDIAAAIHYLHSRTDLAKEGRLGILTSCVSIGPALLAVMQPETNTKVRFFVSIGGYYDLPRTLVYMTTGYYQAQDIKPSALVNHYGKWVYALSMATRLEPTSQKIINDIARQKIANPNTDTEALLVGLDPIGKQVYEFVTNTDPNRALSLLYNLPPKLIQHLKQLNLAEHDLSSLRTRFTFIHGIDDNLIPYGESVTFAQALPESKTRLFLLKGLRHVKMIPNILDAITMGKSLMRFFAERGRND